jgi:hypothetical protein
MRFALSLLTFLACMSPALAQQTAPSERPEDSVPDSTGTGPYPAVKEVDTSLPNHVVYRPADLDALGDNKLGVVLWGNGACAADGSSARHHLAQLASYGYVVIAPGGNFAGEGAAPRPPRPERPTNGLPSVATTANDLRTALDWALAENARESSRYHGKIDPALVAVGGHSCGGLQALELGSDPRIRTVMVHNSGIFADGSNPIPGITVSKSQLKGLHTPVLYVLGGTGDIAYQNGVDDVARIEHVPVFLADLAVGHGGTFDEANGGAVGRISAEWLEWQLRGNAKAAESFTGSKCGLCVDDSWKVQRKRID